MMYYMTLTCVWVINVTHSGAWGNNLEDYWVYWVKYVDFVKYFLFWQYKPNVFTVRRREPGRRNCSVSLENGRQYVVGYAFWVPQFRFVRPKDKITPAEKELMRKMRFYYI
ncbi:hypothetical protein Y032_0846g2662 [Ancylostoma ceylanicum]|uniref:Uncharacterized protein n=1 Tax=Ancylostoma ceylanicum TaxID=53326 RepID=A0A016WAM7_9BILA|nr:hypothetical protein Y032_0846g2662 [Ancylostoma ceylanicum]